MLIAKGLRGGTVRFAICVGGIAVSTMLVLVLFGAYRSVSASVMQFLGQRGQDLWVAPMGTDNLIRASAYLDVTALDEIRRMRGVSRVDPILLRFGTAEANHHRLTLMGIGFRTPGGLGGPPVIESGTMPVAAGEVALDRSAAHRLRVHVGDVLAVNGTDMKVVGITSGTNLLATQFLFGNIDAARASTLPPASFGIIEVAGGASAQEVAERIRQRFPKLEVMTRDSFMANNLREIGSGFQPMLLLISILGVASAALLVAFLIEGVVEQRRGELAVLLATGATPATIATGLMMNAAKLLVAGIAVGAVAAHLLAYLIEVVAPVIPLAYSIGDLVVVTTLLSISGILAAFVPLVRLKDIDPLEAFRS